MKKTRAPKRTPRAAEPAEIALVVDVSALTRDGFVGSTAYEGEKVDVGFDDSGAGLSLTTEMAGRLHVTKGSTVYVTVEGDTTWAGEMEVAAVGTPPRLSDPRTYYAVGREGGAIVKIRKS